MESILSLLLAWALGAVVLMIVSRLGAGLSVEGFVPAFIASAVITIVSWIFLWLFGFTDDGSGWWSALVGLVVAAVILMISGRFVKGMKVNGFGGAIIAAIAYGVIVWLAQSVAQSVAQWMFGTPA